MPTASQMSLNPNDLGHKTNLKKRFAAQDVHLIHHNAVLPDRELVKDLGQNPDRKSSPYQDPYANIPAKPNRVPSRELSQQLQAGGSLTGAAGMVTDLRKSVPSNSRDGANDRHNFANVGVRSILGGGQSPGPRSPESALANYAGSGGINKVVPNNYRTFDEKDLDPLVKQIG